MHEDLSGAIMALIRAVRSVHDNLAGQGLSPGSAAGAHLRVAEERLAAFLEHSEDGDAPPGADDPPAAEAPPLDAAVHAEDNVPAD